MGAVESAPLREDGTPRSYFAQCVDPHGLFVEPSNEFASNTAPELTSELPSQSSAPQAPPSPSSDAASHSRRSSVGNNAYVSLDFGVLADVVGEVRTGSEEGVVDAGVDNRGGDAPLLTGQALMDEGIQRIAGGALLKRLSGNDDAASKPGHRRIQSGENIYRQRLQSPGMSASRLSRPLV